MKVKIKTMSDHKEFLKRINKTLYYAQLPLFPCLSLPVTEVSCAVWSVAQRGRSVRRLRAEEAARMARGGCVSPCTLVLALLYLERLHACNPDYLANTEPSDLFLVTLMVGSKFLEDNGEDEEVLVSEWAEGSGLDVDHIKRLEIEFLKAIDWKVYVSKESFETGLLWLEKQVALRQGLQRGFYTYTDLTVAYDNAVLLNILGSLTTTCLTLTLSYLASLMALVTSTLVISQAWLPSLHYMVATRTTAPSVHNANIIRTNTDIGYLVNITLEEILRTDILVDDSYMSDQVKCCTKWMTYQDREIPNKIWTDSVVSDEWKTSETWWSKTSVLNWLYQSSLINPMQRWLEKLNEFGEFILSEVPTGSSVDSTKKSQLCGLPSDGVRGHCVRHSLNLSKLNALVVTAVTDR